MKQLCLVLLLLLPLVGAQHEHVVPEADYSLAPYFFVPGGEGTDLLPLKATEAEVSIAGVIADVTVTQTYRNEGDTTIEAVYVFPASTRAAVYGLTMQIGERTIEAQIREREQARADYEAARAAGQSATLLEQERPNVFTMNVANILPGDEILVTLRYTELLVPTESIYEFVYPTVVGPRYSSTGEEWNANPFLREGEEAPYGFNIGVTLATGVPVQDVSVPSHRTNIVFESRNLARIELDPSESAGGNRDFIVRYRLAGQEVQSGLLLYEGEEENFFLLMSQPPQRAVTTLHADTYRAGRGFPPFHPEEVVPREYLFIVDISGSMSGFPIEISKALMRDLLTSLRPEERFNVLLFAGSSQTLADAPLAASDENVRRAMNLIDNVRGGGGTEILPALRRALDMPQTEGSSRIILVLTDGLVTVEGEAFDLIRENLGNANMFTFGIGTSINRLLLEGLARVGQGEVFVATSEREAQRMAQRFRLYVAAPVLTDVTVRFNGFEVYDVEPPTVPDVFAERPVIIYGKWRGNPTGTIRVRGTSSEGAYEETFNVSEVEPLETNSALRYLWARNRIALLGDYSQTYGGSPAADAISQLGLSYNLLTAYTSFIAVDTLERADGEFETVRQPLPLPQGVSDAAVGMPFQRSMSPSAPMTQMVRPAPAGMPALPMTPPIPAGATTDASEVEAPPILMEPIVLPRVRLENLETSGGLSVDEVRRALERLEPDLLACNPGTAGSLRVRVRVGARGSVVGLEVLENSFNNDALLKCLVEPLADLTFGSEGEFTVTLRLEL